MIPINNKENQRSPVIRGETVTAFVVKSGARAQPMNVPPEFIQLLVMLQENSTGCIDTVECFAPRKNHRLSSYQLYYCRRVLAVG